MSIPLAGISPSNLIGPEGITREAKVRQLYGSDPYVHEYCSPLTAVDVIANGRYLSESGYKKFKVPLLVTHGTKDVLTR